MQEKVGKTVIGNIDREVIVIIYPEFQWMFLFFWRKGEQQSNKEEI